MLWPLLRGAAFFNRPLKPPVPQWGRVRLVVKTHRFWDGRAGSCVGVSSPRHLLAISEWIVAAPPRSRKSPKCRARRQPCCALLPCSRSHSARPLCRYCVLSQSDCGQAAVGLSVPARSSIPHLGRNYSVPNLLPSHLSAQSLSPQLMRHRRSERHLHRASQRLTLPNCLYLLREARLNSTGATEAVIT